MEPLIHNVERPPLIFDPAEIAQAMSRGRRSSMSSRRGGDKPSKPAEWAGLTPLVDWDFANAAVTAGNIDSVPDSSGNGRTLTSVVKPVYVASSANFNGAPAGSFASTAAYRMTFGNLGTAAGGPLSVMCVATSVNSTGNRYLFSAANDDLYLFSISTGKWQGHVNNATVGTTKNSATPSAYLATVAAGSLKLYISDNNLSASAVATACDISAGGSIGCYHSTPAGGFALNGEVTRVIVFGSELTTAQRAASFAALGSKYALTIIP